jgi:hypothetical protein
MGKFKSLLAAGVLVIGLISSGGVASASTASPHHPGRAATQTTASHQAQALTDGPYLYSWYPTWVQCDVVGTWESGVQYWGYWYCGASLWPPFGYDLYFGWFF